MAAPLRFLFDFVSPYAYLAWTQIRAIATRAARDVEPVPVLFAAMLNAHGQKGPAEIPAKRLYLFKDTLRTARVLGVPFAPPPSHPFNPLLALRASSLAMPEPTRHALVDALFRAAWGGGGGVTDPEAVARIATSVGLDGAATVAAAGADDAKAVVRRRTEDAIAAGVFGVPTTIADGEIFWGVDSLGHLERFLRGEETLDAALVERWRNLEASAQRERR